MNWSNAQRRYRGAVDDLCDYVAEKYDGRGVFQFFFQDKRIVILGKDRGEVSHEDILDWMSDRWQIFINIKTSIVKTEVRYDYYLEYVVDGELIQTPLKHGFCRPSEIFDDCCGTVVKAVQGRIKS